jgi:hypothetical protein
VARGEVVEKVSNCRRARKVAREGYGAVRIAFTSLDDETAAVPAINLLLNAGLWEMLR